MMYASIILGTSILSISSCLLILALFCSIKEIRIPSYRLILYLIIGNLLQAVARLLLLINENVNQRVLCEVSFTTVGIGDVEAMIWTLLYSIQTNIVLTSAGRGQNPDFLFSSKKVEVITLLLGAVSPSLIIIFLYMNEGMQSGGLNGCRALIQDQVNADGADYIQLSINMGYLIGFFIICNSDLITLVVTNLLILRKIIYIQTDKFRYNAQILKRRMITFNLIFFLCNFPFTVKIFYSIINDEVPKPLEDTSSFFLSIWGLLNSCTLAFTPLLIREIRLRLGWNIDLDNGDVILASLTVPSSSSASSNMAERMYKQTEAKTAESVVRKPSGGVLISKPASIRSSESSWLSEV